MEFDEMLRIVGEEPVFHTGLLLAGDVDHVHVRRQLGRWVKAGKVYQLRRGLYALAPPYQQVKPHPFTAANQLVRPSYVSLQSALAYYGLIPEYVPVTTSVTTDRPREFNSPLGKYRFHHIKKERIARFRDGVLYRNRTMNVEAAKHSRPIIPGAVITFPSAFPETVARLCGARKPLSAVFRIGMASASPRVREYKSSCTSTPSTAASFLSTVIDGEKAPVSKLPI